MRERVEDLGRLMVMIDHIIDMELFEELEKQPFEKTGIDVVVPRYNLQDVKDKLYECLSICKGFDYLNEEKE